MTHLARAWLSFALLLLLAAPVQAQQETLISGDLSYGGYGGPVLRMTNFESTPALLVGGRGGWILNVAPNHAIVLGGAGYGLVTNVRIDGLRTLDGRPVYLELGYGGLMIEYINNTNQLVHYTLDVLVGAGGAGFRDDDFDSLDVGEAFFVAEPSLHVMVNITTFFRAGLGVGYRFATETDLEDARGVAIDFSGPSGGLTLKFGEF